MEHSRVFNIAILTIFAIGLTAPLLAYSIGMRPSEFEERPLATSPSFSAARILDASFYEQLGAYLKDLHPLRKPAVVANARIAAALFGDGATAETVKGRGDWLFIRESIRQPCIPEETFRTQMGNVAELGRALQEKGVAFSFTIAPDKAAIYPERLTKAATAKIACGVSNRSAVLNAGASLNPFFIDLWGILRDLKDISSDPVFSPDDTHWTQYGSAAFVAEIVRRHAPELTWSAIAQYGVETINPDESRMAGIWAERRQPIVRFVRTGEQHRDSQTISHEPPGGDYVRNVSVSTDAPLSGRRILFVHDSYIYVAWDQVSQFFADSFYIHWSALTAERFAALASQADVVIIETVERVAYERMRGYFNDSQLADAVRNASPSETDALALQWPSRGDGL